MKRTKDVLRERLPKIIEELESLDEYMREDASEGYESAQTQIEIALDLIKKSHPDN